MKRVEEYRRYAAECRDMARTAPLAHRQKLQQMAQTWQQLAQELRKRFAEPMRVELDGRSTGEAILAAAQSLDCDLLIKGAYTQSRLRQTIFGGATQHIMAKATMPVLLAN